MPNKLTVNIAVSGPPGAGKTTIAALIQQALEQAGLTVEIGGLLVTEGIHPKHQDGRALARIQERAVTVILGEYPNSPDPLVAFLEWLEFEHKVVPAERKGPGWYHPISRGELSELLAAWRDEQARRSAAMAPSPTDRTPGDP